MGTGAATSKDDAGGRPPSRPLLPGFFRVIPMGDDGVQLRSAGRVIRLSGPGIGDVAPTLLGALDGRSTTPELAERFGFDLAVIDALVGRLTASGVVQDATARDRAPALAAVGDHLAELGLDPTEVQATLGRARIGVVGLGPVARLAARHLATAGVGELVLVDDATVSDDAIVQPAGARSVPMRQRSDVVSEECEAASGGSTRVFRRPKQRSGDAEAVASLLAEVDVAVVEAVETGEPAIAFNLACLQGGGRLLPFAITSREAFVGPLVQRPGTPCFLCAQTRRLSHLRHHDAFIAYRQAINDGAMSAPRAAVLAGHVGLVAALVGLEALRIVGGFALPATAEAVLVADFSTLEVHREDVLSVPGCAACGRDAARLA